MIKFTTYRFGHNFTSSHKNPTISNIEVISDNLAIYKLSGSDYVLQPLVAFTMPHTQLIHSKHQYSPKCQEDQL